METIIDIKTHNIQHGDLVLVKVKQDSEFVDFQRLANRLSKDLDSCGLRDKVAILILPNDTDLAVIPAKMAKVILREIISKELDGEELQ